MDELENTNSLQQGIDQQSREAQTFDAKVQAQFAELEADIEPQEPKPPVDIKKLDEGDEAQQSFLDKSIENIKAIGDITIETGKTLGAVALGGTAGVLAEAAGAPEIKQRQEQFAAGALDYIQDIGNGVVDIVEAVGLREPTPDPFFTFSDSLFPKPQTDGERNARAVGRFAANFASFAGGGMAAGALKGSMFVKGAASIGTSAGLNFLAFDPNEEKIGGIVKDIPGVREIMPDFLSAQEGDTEMDLRMKNAISNTIDDVVLAGAFFGISKMYQKARAYKGAIQKSPLVAKAEGAVVKEGDEAVSQVGKSGEPISANKPKTLAKTPEQLDLTKTPLEPNPEQKAYLDKSMEALKDSFGDSPGARAYMQDFVERNWDDIVKNRGGIRTAEVRRQMQEGLQVETLLDPSTGKILDDAQTEALGGFIEKNVDDMLASMQAGDVEGALGNLSAADEALKPYIMRYSASGTEAARALGVRRQFKDAMAVKARLQQKILMAATPEERKDIVQKISEVIAKDPRNKVKNMIKFLDGSRTGSWADSAFDAWYSSMLSNPVTWSKNAGGNTVMLGKQISEKYVAATSNYWKGGGEITFAEANMKSKAAFQSIMDGINAIRESQGARFRFGRQMVAFKRASRGSDLVKFGESAAPFQALRNAGVPQALKIVEPGFKKVTTATANILSIPFNVLKRTDDFSKTVNYSSELKALSFRKAQAEGLEIGSKEFGERMAQMEERLVNKSYESFDPVKTFDVAKKHAEDSLGLKGPDAERMANQAVEKMSAESSSLRDINKQAAETAKRATFTQAPREGGAQEAALNLLDRLPLRMGKIVVPFSRVSLNIVKEVVESTPGLSYISKDFRDALAMGGAARETAMARVQLGGSLVAIGALAAEYGIVKGSEPKSKSTRNALLAKGESFNSIGGVKLDTLGPIGDMLRIGADFREYLGYITDEDEKNKLTATFAFLGSEAIKTMSPDSMTEGVYEVLSIAASEDPEKLKAFVAGIGRSTVPGALRFVQRDVLGNNEKRSTRAESGYESWKDVVEQTMNEWQANIPGLSEGLPPQRNLFGEVIHYPPGMGSAVLSAIALSKDAGSQKKNQLAFDEIARLGLQSSFMKEDLPPGEAELRVDLPPRTLVMDGIKMKLNPHQYDRYVQLSAGIGLGSTETDKEPEKRMQDERLGNLRDSLNSLIKNDYKSADGLGRVGIIYGDGRYHTDQNKRESIKAVINQYRELAKEQMLDEFPDLLNKRREGLINKATAADSEFSMEGLGGR